MTKMPHIQLDASICATAAILPGDPARVDEIVSYLTDVRWETFSREYKSATGTYKGRRILAISTGMGGPSTAICVEELADLGVTDLVRIGSCGALQSHLRLGELVLCDRAVCDDGTSQAYLNYFRYACGELNGNSPASPGQTQNHDTARTGGLPGGQAPVSPARASDGILCAYANGTLLQACADAARELGFPFDIGATRCHDALYLSRKQELDHFYSGKGIFASDMETSTLFAVGAHRKIRAASILNVVVEWEKDIREGISSYKEGADAAARGEKNEILVALEALSR